MAYQDGQLIYPNNADFQIKLKIQNEKLNPLPDPFALDWDNLSETEMKRLVGQLEKTRADLLVGILHLLQKPGVYITITTNNA